ncbi:Fur family transcriptional regulator [Anaerosalibacter massiliensis]|uniref:Transcriptional repressor n=1 Tax=Anaerosalibacter massiliensis TaxID=1347392 RepID=A0A9X2MJG8_9FIRM|nr:Fur family transcriptional regulator [Anaerosalibacter massiliensis]MCR2044764.1 transcriptional repressor [Anaerosalibacter massiliensis]
MPFTVEVAKQSLKEHNIKPSTIRIKILQYLMDNKLHPTADHIYKYLINDIPTLSKTSVYNTLELFLENNLVNIVTIDDKESRYDINTSTHGHFKCEKCNKIYDFHISSNNLNGKEIDGFIINNKKIYYEGICKECLRNLEKI